MLVVHGTTGSQLVATKCSAGSAIIADDHSWRLAAMRKLMNLDRFAVNGISGPIFLAAIIIGGVGILVLGAWSIWWIAQLWRLAAVGVAE